MTKLDELTIGEAKELSRIFNPAQPLPCGTLPGSSVKIVVLQRGWVVVGKTSRVGDEVTISDATVVRRWGTTKGIGELAANGPLKDTVLDPCGDVRVDRLGIVASIDCVDEKWRAICK